MAWKSPRRDNLSARNFSFSDEIMMEEDGTLNFYVDADFDVDAAFGTFVLTDKTMTGSTSMPTTTSRRIDPATRWS